MGRAIGDTAECTLAVGVDGREEGRSKLELRFGQSQAVEREEGGGGEGVEGGRPEGEGQQRAGGEVARREKIEKRT